MSCSIYNYDKFKIELEKKTPDFKPTERVIYMLRHPVYLKKIGGNLALLADYLMLEAR